MSPDESPENGGDELTFPAPWKLPIFESWYVQGQCHRLPREGSFLSEIKRLGSQAVSNASAVRPGPAGHNQLQSRVTLEPYG